MMRRTLLITGGQGMLATDIAAVGEEGGFAVHAFGHAELDVTNPRQVREAMDAVRPDVVVHTVGLLVDPCETDPAEAHRVHVWGTGLVARHCERVGATLVHFSTCGLFGDAVRYYAEDDPVHCKTEYARSKHRAEAEAERWCRRTFTIRPGWLYGGHVTHKKNFVASRYQEAKREAVLKSAIDKHGCPTWTRDLARGTFALAETGEYGCYHLTNQGGGTRYEYVRRIVTAFGLATPVEPVDSSAFPRTAPVPACELLANRHCGYLGLPPLPPWQDALERYVRQIRAAL
ncbi:MAG: NAD(P)-dependent oxidoreductase [Deltaproteobacteria bacterium]|nr:NAD(P)-dependent oxidoreductase [Deltaproteobacteria bacterium]